MEVKRRLARAIDPRLNVDAPAVIPVPQFGDELRVIIQGAKRPSR